MKRLTSSDRKEQECGRKLADEMLKKGAQKEIYEDGEVKIKSDRSVINKYPSKDDDPSDDPNQMSRGRLFIHLYSIVFSARRVAINYKLTQFI